MSIFYWKQDLKIAGLNSLLETLAEEYPEYFSMLQGDIELVFKKTTVGKLTVSLGKTTCTIEAGALSGFARGLGCAMAGTPVKESTPFNTMGIMVDCSRNKVPTLAFLKSYFVRIALMGYNMAMLYTENTYKLPGEPVFDHMRGGYTMDEIKELDAFAKKIGIELIACIQTLGHLEQMLRWDEYSAVRDTGGVVLVDAPETYALIEKMIKFWKEALSSSRIHIGMDETHDLGRGRYMDYNGYESPFTLFTRHLGKVNEICRKYDLKPIIWSDMFFRLGNKKLDYYDVNTKIPAKVRKEIPKNVQLCYWDYYHDNAAFYEDYILKHRALGSEPILGSGVWTWNRSWYDHLQTAATVVPCMEACRKTKLKEIFFTMWGDWGGYCLYHSALAGLEFASGLAYGNLPNDNKLYGKRLFAVAGIDYDLCLSVSRIAGTPKKPFIPEFLLWDDPLFGMQYNRYETRDAKGFVDYEKMIHGLLTELAKKDLEDLPDFLTIQAFLQALSCKISFRRNFIKAYAKRDRQALRKIANEDIPAVISCVEEYDLRFRECWLNDAKPFGLEVLQHRNAGLIARLKEARLRILELLEGVADCIEELDAALEVRGKTTSAKIFSGSTSMC